jgi:hypothetical protein
MAIAYTVVARYPDQRKTVVDITLDGSYASGGYALDNRQLGLIQAPDSVDPYMVTGDGFTPTFVASTNKLKIFKSAGAAGAHTECVAGDLTSSVKVRCDVTGVPSV